MNTEHDQSTPEPGRTPTGQLAASGMPVGQAFDAMPFTRKHVVAGGVLLFAFIVDAWEMLILSYVAGPVQQELGIGATGIGFLISAMFLGMIPGALLWGPVTDRIGRRKACVLSLGGYGVVALLSALSVSFWMLWGLRFVAGFVMAGVFTMVFPYFEELLPTRHRGRATVFLAAGWPFGVFLAVGISAAFLEVGGWRLVIAVSALAGLWAVMIWKYVPESPYWLVAHGRQAEAKAVLRELSGGATNPEAELTVASGGSTLRAILAGRVGRFTVLQVILNFAFSWGYWGLATWLPELLQERGLSVSGSFSFIAATTVAMIPGYASAAYLTGRFGRKWVFVAYIGLGALGGFSFAFAQSMTQLFVASCVMYFFAQGAWGVWDTWIGELYTTQTRSLGYSLAIAGQRVANAVAPSVIGLFVAVSVGFSWTVAFIIGFLVVALLLSLTFPETEGKELA